MTKKFGLILAIIMILYFIPSTVFAVDFSIDQSKIETFLQENGEAEVVEQHTYQFDGEFNGMTRTLIPKAGSSIHDVRATEKGKALEVKQEDDTYKIYRRGENETVTIQLSYIIKDSLKAYKDVVVFAWPFFDSSNETAYEQLDIFIHPPRKTEDVVAYGEDTAFKTEKQEDGGVIHYTLGYVESGENGDITVAYDKSLFPGVSTTENKPMREELLATEQKLMDKEKAFVERQSTLKDISPYILSTFTIFSLVLLFFAWRRIRVQNQELARTSESASFLPKQEMSLPATIAYMKRGQIGSKDMTASLLDLERKGYIKRDEKDKNKFVVVHKQTDHEHETILMDWLFYTIGQNGVFHATDLQEYIKTPENQKTYQKKMLAYKYSVKKEIADHKLIDKPFGIRVTAALLGLTTLPFIIIFAIHELFGSMAISFLYFIVVSLFAIAYRPRTLKGARIYKQWQEFEEKYPHLPAKEWKTLVRDEQKRTFIYGLGVNRAPVTQKNNQLFENTTSSPSHEANSDLMMLLLVAAVVNEQFDEANSTVTAAATDTTISSSGGGTGVGGGGGGSGAF
ncbi:MULTISPECIES: DUF2207 domain-containing protein [Clostridia]|uniref:DUF2207 domain-containing protein n=1 Tax=Clostridia TaxID=186801 RepID=UPI000EA30F85|nr:MULTISPECIES: DUF2207 domain-containing protein [Clostridia]NBJ70712.1 DUF2207 domain-containing protein [Roseburia sp. 1XD42-34]RKI76826.1 DUF2207 domain-containing protein [Clostridium sp. 1xD42-85]